MADSSAHAAHPYSSLDSTKLWKRIKRPWTGMALFKKTDDLSCSNACLAAPSRALISFSKSRFMANRTPRCLYSDVTLIVRMWEFVAVVMKGVRSMSNKAVRHWLAPGPRYITTISDLPRSRLRVSPRLLNAECTARIVSWINGSM